MRRPEHITQAIAGGAVLLLACGCTTRYHNVIDPDAGQTQFDADHYACEQQNPEPINTSGNPYVAAANLTADLVAIGMIDDCMKAAGWYPLD